MNARIVAVGLILTVLAWFSAYNLVRQDFEDEVERTRQLHSNILKGMEVQTLSLLQDANEVLLLMEQTFKKQKSITPEVRAILSSASFSRFTDQAALIDANGNLLFSFALEGAAVNVADRAYFQAHIPSDTGKLFIGPLVIGRVTGQPVFHVSRRISNPDGSFGGVATVAISSDYFTDFFQQITLEPINYLLIGVDGLVRAASDDNRHMLGATVEDESFRQAVAESAESGMYRIITLARQELRFVSFRFARKYGLYSVITQLDSDALSLFYQRRFLYYGAAALFTLLLPFLLHFLYRASKQQQEMRQSVQAAMERAEYYLDMAGALLVALDLSGRVTMLNQRGSEILGYAETELLGQNWIDTIIPPEHRELVRIRFQETINGNRPAQKSAADMEVLTRDGKRRIISWTNNVLRNLQGEIVGTLSSGVDVTERRHMEAELLRLVATDPLTGLSNRRNLLEAGQREFQLYLRQQRSLSVCLMDIDHFKRINDRFGHAIGDLVLVRLAEVCLSTLRTADLCGRFGGEEFVIILPDTPLETACIAAERLREKLEREIVDTPAGSVQFTVSIGVASAEPNHSCIDDVIRMADVYMYAAKNSGRNRAVSKITMWRDLPEK